MLRGRPATAIAAEDEEWQADVLVVGSRGHGPFQTLVLGSVSAELVHHAPCPVLIARRPAVERVVLAHDGSPFAASAEQLLLDCSPFTDAAVEVVTVTPVHRQWASTLTQPRSGPSLESSELIARQTLERHQEIASSAVLQLQRGRAARPAGLQGHPAAAIVDHARETDADLIVVGTHGRTGISRLMVGSVARAIVTHATASVLVVRPRVPEDRSGSRVAGGHGMTPTGLSPA